MSGLGVMNPTHDVGERLKRSTRATLSVTNVEHDPDKARERMRTVCIQCRSPRWTDNYLLRFDHVVESYNESYYKPAEAIMDRLYERGVQARWPMFDEKIEFSFYELWHHSGRRVRMGAAMQGPDYAWWHGFYELKKNYQELIHMAAEAEEKGHSSPTYLPGTGGRNETTADTPPMPRAWKDVPNLLGMPEGK